MPPILINDVWKSHSTNPARCPKCGDLEKSAPSKNLSGLDALREKTIKGIFRVGNILAVDIGMKEEVDVALLLLGR